MSYNLKNNPGKLSVPVLVEETRKTQTFYVAYERDEPSRDTIISFMKEYGLCDIGLVSEPTWHRGPGKLSDGRKVQYSSLSSLFGEERPFRMDMRGGHVKVSVYRDQNTTTVDVSTLEKLEDN